MLDKSNELSVIGLCNFLTSKLTASTRTAGSSGRQQLTPSLKKSAIFCFSFFKTFCRQINFKTGEKCGTFTVIVKNNRGYWASR